MRTVDDLFGGVVAHKLFADKSILHKPYSYANLPHEFSNSFAASVADFVLPGYSCFDKNSTLSAYEKLSKQYGQIRLKDASETDAAGQYLIKSKHDLLQILTSKYGQLPKSGIVLEPHIINHQTLSVGQISIGGQDYSYYGEQHSVEHEGRQKYGGTNITMYRGGLEKLSKVDYLDDALKLGIFQSSKVLDAFSQLSSILSRANFDVVQGNYGNGEFASGVVDQSLRLGGASPAEMVAVKALLENPNMQSVNASVELNYEPNSENLDSTATVFLNADTLRITAKAQI